MQAGTNVFVEVLSHSSNDEMFTRSPTALGNDVSKCIEC